jgi:hypothetical protein
LRSDTGLKVVAQVGVAESVGVKSEDQHHGEEGVGAWVAEPEPGGVFSAGVGGAVTAVTAVNAAAPAAGSWLMCSTAPGPVRAGR